MHNKQIKSWAKAHWDANTQGRFAIMPYALSPLIQKLCFSEDILENLVKVSITLTSDNIQNASTETMWAEPLGNDLYRLQNSPFAAYGFSYLDVVKAIGNETPEVVEIVESSGHSTYRVQLETGVLESDRFGQYWQKLENIGCTFEGSQSKLLSIDVPPSTDIFTAYSILESGESAGVWEFEEAKCAHSTET